MTREEYLQLIHSSQSFKMMDPELQQKILNAKGAEMLQYAQIFTQEAQTVDKATQNLAEKNTKVLKDFDQQVKVVNHEHLVKIEKLSEKEDNVAAENLLKNL